MPPPLATLCADFYVNQKLSLKLDLPSARDTVLHMFDRIRRDVPRMDRFRRYDDELALESPELDARYEWIALNRTALRSGWVNPESLEEAYALHRLILEIAPYYLSISALDVEFVELTFGFDLECEGNRSAVVMEALYGDSPLGLLVDGGHEQPLDVQPLVGLVLNRACDLQAFVEVKTRQHAAELASGRFEPEPISVYLTVRRYGPFQSLEDLSGAFGTLSGHAERLAEERVIPNVVAVIRQAIG